MLKNLKLDYNLRGYTFEYISKILLRREKQNNFIFQSVQFDSLEELLNKYRLNSTKEVEEKINNLSKHWKKFDLIEFILENKNSRLIKEIIIYEVKTKGQGTKRDYFEVCISNHKFLKSTKEINLNSFICSIILFEDWRFSFNLIPYERATIRTYSNFKKIQ